MIAISFILLDRRPPAPSRCKVAVKGNISIATIGVWAAIRRELGTRFKKVSTALK